MSSESYSAGAGAIVAGAEATARAREEVSKSIDQVRAAKDNVGAAWMSSGATAMRNSVDRWIEACTRVNNRLIKLEQDLRSTDQDYVVAEEEQSTVFKNVEARMG